MEFVMKLFTSLICLATILVVPTFLAGCHHDEVSKAGVASGDIIVTRPNSIKANNKMAKPGAMSAATKDGP